MKKEVIYGIKPADPNPTFVELTLKDDNKLDINICYEGDENVWHLIMKNPDKYQAFKDELIKEANQSPDEIWMLNEFVDGQDVHDNYELDFDCPAQNTKVLVSMDEIDDYIEEVENRLEVMYTNEGCLTDLSDKPQYVIDALCHLYNIDPKQPLDNFSDDYWCGVLATLRWITMGSEKHDSQVLD